MACAAGELLQATPLDRLVQRGRQDGVVAPHAGRRQSSGPQAVVEGVEVPAAQAAQLLVAELLDDLGGQAPILEQRLGSPAPDLDVGQPALEEPGQGLALERDLALGGILHQPGRFPLGCPPAAPHGGADVAVPLGPGVAAERHPHLPNARRAFT